MSAAPYSTFPSWIRRSLRVIRMVSEFHRMGFQHLRIFPYVGSVGAWRLTVAPRAACHVRNGGYVPWSATEAFEHCMTGDAASAQRARIIGYTSASESEYFGWKDAKADRVRDLVEKFIKRFPAAADAGRGRDWEYAGWLDELLGELEKSPRLPFVIDEDFKPGPLDLRILPILELPPDSNSRVSLDFPLPPGGGYARDD